MKNFQFSRFVALFKLDLAQNKKSYIAFSLILFVLYFLLELMTYATTLTLMELSPRKEILMLHDMAGLYFPVSVFVMIMGASWVFSVLKTKKQRISYLMLPASNLEKFLCRLLICTVGVFLVNGLVFALTDIVRSLLFVAFGKPSCFTLPTLYQWHVNVLTGHADGILYASGRYDWTEVFNALSMIGAFMSIFILGSSIFRKHSFVYTAVVLLTLSIIFNMIFMGQNHSVIIVGGYIKLGLFTLLMLVLSYWQFKRSVVMRRSLF